MLQHTDDINQARAKPSPVDFYQLVETVVWVDGARLGLR